MSDYLKIVMRNVEPVRVSDAATSQSGQTMTFRYLPGTAVRGFVINALAAEPDFAQIKQTLFSPRIRYLNAFLTDRGQALLPSPKGFYEDKTAAEGKKEIRNVIVDRDSCEGCKRAALGRFCRMSGDCIDYYQVETGSDLKIKINLKAGEKQNVFRNEYIAAGYVFTGYIAVEEESLKERIRSVFDRQVILGSGRSAGLGKCEILECVYTDRLPYEDALVKEEQPSSCYMMLLSNTAMRGANGEICGIDPEKLGTQLGVKNLRIDSCAASTVAVKGYSRVWKGPVPSVTMYEQGSVFLLRYDGTLTKERMHAVCDQGIGIRVNEGFGRVLFLQDYDKIRYKQAAPDCRGIVREVDASKITGDDETLKTAARVFYRRRLQQAMNRYVVDHPMITGNISDSQFGTLESFAAAYKYDPQKAKRMIFDFLNYAGEKEQKNRVQKEKNSMKELKTYVSHIFETDLEELLRVRTKNAHTFMGLPKQEIFSADDADRMRLELMIRMNRYRNKKEES